MSPGTERLAELMIERVQALGEKYGAELENTTDTMPIEDFRVFVLTRIISAIGEMIDPKEINLLVALWMQDHMSGMDEEHLQAFYFHFMVRHMGFTR